MTNERSRYSFLAKNVFWLVSIRVIAILATFITLPIVTAYLDPGAFGIIALFAVESSLLSGLSNLGLNSFASRMVYKYDHRNKEKCRQYLGISFLFLALFSLIGCLIALPFAKPLKELVLKGVFFPSNFLFYIPIIDAFFRNIYGFTTNGFLSLQQNKNIFICTVLEIILLTPSKIIGLVWLRFTWVQIVVLEVTVTFIVSMLSLWLMRGKLSFSFRRLRIIPYAIRYSLPYLPLNFSSWIRKQIDKIFLVRMYTTSLVGVYAIGEKAGGIFSYFSKPVATVIKPEIAKRLDSRSESIQNDITDFFNLFFQVFLFLIFFASIFSREMFMLLINTRYLEAFKIIPLLMFGMMFSELSGIFRMKFIYKNKTIYFPIVILLGAFLNALLNYCLIPKLGIMGAATAAALANLAVVFFCYFVSQRLHFTRYDMVKNFSALIAVAIAIFLIQNMFSLSVFTVFVKCAIAACYAVILYLYLLRVNKRFKGLLDTLLTSVKSVLKRA